MAEIADHSTAASEEGRVTAWLRFAFASMEAVARAFGGESVRLRAMSLTYLTLFALVPALVVVFIVVQAFTGMDRISSSVHEFLLENLAVGARESLEPYLDRFVMNAHPTSIGLVGGGLLIYSSVNLFGQIERAVNDIWMIRRRRPIRQQLFTYWAGITLGPLLLAASATLGYSTRDWLGQFRFGAAGAVAAALLLTCAFFTIVYLMVPAIKVRLLPALVGGLLAGVAWYVAKSGYTWFMGRFFRFHAIYGSVAAFPIMLTWLYLSWVLLLFGARVAYVAQNARALFTARISSQTPSQRELLAARAMLEVAIAFHEQSAPPDATEIASRLEVLSEPVEEVLALLREGELLVDLAGGGIAPSRPLEAITLADIRRIVSGSTPLAKGERATLVAGIMTGAEDLATRALSEVTYASLSARSLEKQPVQAVTELDATRRVGVLPTS